MQTKDSISARPLKLKEVAEALGVSKSEVKYLWNIGKLAYKIMPNVQRTRVSTMPMIEAYQRHLMRGLIG